MRYTTGELTSLHHELVDRVDNMSTVLAHLSRQNAALLARVEQLTRRVTDLEGRQGDIDALARNIDDLREGAYNYNAIYRDEPDGGADEHADAGSYGEYAYRAEIARNALRIDALDPQE